MGDKGTQPARKRDRIGFTLWILYLLLLVASVVIGGRIVYIQLFYEPAPRLASLFRPSSTKVKLDPVRGSIFSRDGKLLAMSIPAYQVFMDCAVLKDNYRDQPAKENEWRQKARDLSAGLARIYGDKSAEEYYRMIISGREHNKRNAAIGYPIDNETFKQVKALPLFREGPFKGGFKSEKRSIRQYPYGTLARRTIGYVKDNSRSNGNNMIGLEGSFDEQLRGREGFEWMKITDNRGLIRNTDSAFVRPVDGMDLRTTLDIDIQDIADKALRRQIEENPKIEGGCAVVMDVKTGAIRAMVNLLRDQGTGLLGESYNFAVGRSGEPGSVFKSTTLMTLLEDGKVTLRTKIPTNHGVLPGYKNPDTHIYDYEKKNNTDSIPVLDGFEMSSNYVFRKLAIDNYGKTPHKMLDRLQTYKLGEVYDFDLGGFAKPTIPSPESRSWSKTDLGSVAIGYTVSVTPLHTVTFYNAIANRGRMMKPYLVESVEENGSVKKKYGPVVLNPSICSKATADSLIYALSMVIEKGTGRRRLSGAKASVAGKTGTSRRVSADPKRISPYEDSQGRIAYQATFVGFFPVEKPEYTAIVIAYSYPSHETFFGGTLPAMAFREIVDKVYALGHTGGGMLTHRGDMPVWKEKD